MRLSSGYIFAKQISAGGTPPVPDNVYFENGVFNPNLVPTGFDFENNEAIYYYRDDWGRLIWDGDYHDDAVNGTIARLKIDPDSMQDEKWVLTNNSLQFVHERSQDPSASGDIGEVLFLPVVGWKPAYAYTCIEYELITEDDEYIHSWILYINTYCYDDWLIGEGEYCYDVCDGEQITDPTHLSTMSIHSVNEDSVPVQSIDLIEIGGCPYYNEYGFTVNITKIYGTNTDPNGND